MHFTPNVTCPGYIISLTDNLQTGGMVKVQVTGDGYHAIIQLS